MSPPRRHKPAGRAAEALRPLAPVKAKPRAKPRPAPAQQPPQGKPAAKLPRPRPAPHPAEPPAGIKGELEDEAKHPALHGRAMVDATYAHCQAAKVDPAAMLAVSLHEGASGAIGDSGWAYGPWQDHMTQYKGRPWYGAGRNNKAVQRWAWSDAGIAYAVRSAASAGAAGKTGHSAVHAIVYGYERPAKPAPEFASSVASYDMAHRAHSPRDYFAEFEVGVSGEVGPPPGAVPPPAPPKHKPSSAGVGWRELMHTVGRELPARAAQIRANAKKLHAAVR